MNNNEEKEIKKTNQGLEAIKIGELKQPKSRLTSLIMFVVMSLFIAVVFFLPDINDFIKKMTTPSTSTDKTSAIILEDNNQNHFPLNNQSKIFIQNHRLTRFTKYDDTKTLEFKIANYTTEQSSIDSKNWYIRFYDENKNYLDFVKITGQIIPPDKEMNFKVNLNENTNQAKFILVGKIEESDYPEVKYTINEEGEKYFTCEKNKKQFSYFFNENKLFKVIEYYEANNAELDKSNEFGEGNIPLSEVVKETYEVKYNNFENNPNVEATFVTSASGFIYKVIIDLSDGKFTSIDEKYFTKDVESKKIFFAMKSEGFDCK